MARHGKAHSGSKAVVAGKAKRTGVSKASAGAMPATSKRKHSRPKRVRG